MNALTPAMVAGSTLTPRRWRISGNVATVSAAALATSAFHSSADFGCAFQMGESGRAITACMAGLTVSGTGISCSGTWRSAFSANDAETPASAMPIAASAMRRLFMAVLPLFGCAQSALADCVHSKVEDSLQTMSERERQGRAQRKGPGLGSFNA